MKYSEVGRLGFEIEELVVGVQQVNAIGMDNDELITDMSSYNFDLIFVDNYFDLADYYYTVKYLGKVVLEEVGAEEVEEFFKFGDYKKYLDIWND